MYLGIFRKVLNEKLLNKTNADEIFTNEIFYNFRDAYYVLEPSFAIVKNGTAFDYALMQDQMKYVKNETLTRTLNKNNY